MPDIELRLSGLYAWIVIVSGLVFFFLSLLFMAPQSKGRNVGLGVFLCLLSIGAVIGGNYWRHHMPVMVRMSRSHLSLPGMWPRRLVIGWSEIEAIDKKTVSVLRHGVRQSSEFVCIKLRKTPAATDPLSQAWPAYKRLNEALVKGVKTLVGGYDVFINPAQDFMRDTDWFIAECRKRMPANSAQSS
ncbi:MAG TPA: hypothetical protein VNX88_13045 [Terriglobales bacterium]|jgi:hypothetical protein|nr:hypothetical protein [Terriglobales bacterium]